MEDSSFISIKDFNRRYDAFVKLMNATTRELKDSAATGRIDYAKNQGEKLEWIVLEQMKVLASKFNFDPENIIHTERQHFPDIISEDYFGVEVKATKENSWISTGSSITESLREDCVKKVFLLFGKLSVPDVDFRCKPYEDCLYDISVTHNPRYLINMDLSQDDKTVFQKLGVDYDHFRFDNNRITKIRSYYRDKYKRNNKEMPWWIDDESESSRIKNTGALKLYSEISKDEKGYLTQCGIILFPEVLISKYDRLAMWLCSRHSIVNPHVRDMYSAGGKIDIYINQKCVLKEAPKCIGKFLMSIDGIRDIFNESSDIYDEISYYSDYYSIGTDAYIEWVKVVNKHIKSLGLDIDDVMKLTFIKKDGENIFLDRIDKNEERKYHKLFKR